MALGSTQPLTEMITRNISLGGLGGGERGVTCGRCVGLTNLSLLCADCPDIWEPQRPGTLRTVQTCTGIAIPFLPTSLSVLN